MHNVPKKPYLTAKMLLTTASMGAMIVGLSAAHSAYAADAASGASEVEEILVTGSFVKRKSQSNMSSPMEIYDDQTLAKSGFSNLGAAVALMPANVGSIGGVADLAAGNVNDNRNSRSANLRGLGPASTCTAERSPRGVAGAGRTAQQLRQPGCVDPDDRHQPD